MQSLKIGMIGSGYMGKAYVLALKTLPTVFNLPVNLVLETVATSNYESAAKAADSLGFNRSTGNWRDIIEDPEIDIVISCTPNFLHKEVALATIAAGKHILTEKPMGLDAPESKEMAQAAQAANVKTMVGYCYAKNPATQLAREIIQRGEIGELVHFRGTHIEDYLMDPQVPADWRVEQAKSGSGALGDLCHIINIAEYLCGDIDSVVSDTQIIHPQRKNHRGEMQVVENDDQAHFLCRFENGLQGYLECSRVAAGKKMGLTYEITGTLGTLYFDQARLSELKLYTKGDDVGREGFRTILIGPDNPDYGNFNVGPGHGLGYNDQLTIQMRDFICGIMHDTAIWPDFEAGYASAKVVDAVLLSAQQRRWVDVNEVDG